MAEWNSSWRAFLASVGALCDEGFGEKEIAERFSNGEVVWTGVVCRLNLQSKFVPGIQFKMPEIEIPLKNGHVIREHHLYLNIAPSEVQHWCDISIDETIKFQARIKDMKKTGPFNPVSLVFHDDDNFVNVEISTEKGLPVI